MGRIDYFDDPSAPAANSLVVAVVVAVFDHDRILMIQRSDNGRWSLPGGGQELGESVRDAAVRETHEETGIDVEITGLVGIYSDPRHVIAYDNGEVRQEFAICLRAIPLAGSIQTSGESLNVRWLRAEEITQMDVASSTSRRVRDAFTHDKPHID